MKTRTLDTGLVYVPAGVRWMVMDESLRLGQPRRARDSWLISWERAQELAARLRAKVKAGELRDEHGQPVPPGGLVLFSRPILRESPVTLEACPACAADAEVGFAGTEPDGRPVILRRCTRCALVEQLEVGAAR